jgi:hypothetical protein
MIMACVYLCYSAFFLSQDFKETAWMMKIMMALMFLFLGICYLRNIKETLQKH